MKKTIIYYTANREDPVFEQKIVDEMLSQAGNLPIISISQKPMKLGHNVCIGDVGFSYLNERKQILMAAKLATTEYVITAESDFLYPRDYFEFEPKGDNIYRYANVWIMWLTDRKRPYFYRKRTGSDGAQIVKREFFIELLERYLKSYPGWYEKNDPKRDPRHSPYHHVPHTPVELENPSISVKSRFGLTYMTALDGRPENIQENLPYWGDVHKLRTKLS